VAGTLAKPKRAFVTGVTGQDGSYLAELLLAKGYEVHRIKRRSSSFNTERVDHLLSDWHERDAKFFMHFADLADASSLSKLLYRIVPDEIYHLGAQSHVRVSFDIPEYPVYVVHRNSPAASIPARRERVEALRVRERSANLAKIRTYKEFGERVGRIGERLRAYIESERERNHEISVYGASTKGNTLLQVFGLDRSLIRSAAERNPENEANIRSAPGFPLFQKPKRARTPTISLFSLGTSWVKFKFANVTSSTAAEN
jgi:hypothetical protein